jgi:hypothetical protein
MNLEARKPGKKTLKSISSPGFLASRFYFNSLLAAIATHSAKEEIKTTARVCPLHISTSFDQGERSAHTFSPFWFLP